VSIYNFKVVTTSFPGSLSTASLGLPREAVEKEPGNKVELLLVIAVMHASSSPGFLPVLLSLRL